MIKFAVIEYFNSSEEVIICDKAKYDLENNIISFLDSNDRLLAMYNMESIIGWHFEKESDRFIRMG